MVNHNRIRILKNGSVPGQGTVVYWMSRDQRVSDNWAMIYSSFLAREKQTEFAVVFTLVDEFLNATPNQFAFLLAGLQEVEIKLASLNIPFYLLYGDPPQTLAHFCRIYKVSAIVCDFDPLRIKKLWKQQLLHSVGSSVYEVDTHNIVPCFAASDKQEYGAYTLRPKILRRLNEFLTDFPDQEGNPGLSAFSLQTTDWSHAGVFTGQDKASAETSRIIPGERAANERYREFIREHLNRYASEKNDPLSGSVSGLSPYLHFGQVSSQRIALEIIRTGDRNKSSAAFLEELIIRKELSDNFCYYNSDYDNFTGFPPWARKSLDEHRKDEREYLYNLPDFESTATHDPLWNAAQNEMIRTGRMHGYLRMYWAKKILEWTASPEDALQTAIYLNDKYALDGRDPNGYTGCAWSVGGVHDRAWSDRPVYGKIRYMNYQGCRRKFDVDRYIKQFES